MENNLLDDSGYESGSETEDNELVINIQLEQPETNKIKQMFERIIKILYDISTVCFFVLQIIKPYSIFIGAIYSITQS